MSTFDDLVVHAAQKIVELNQLRAQLENLSKKYDEAQKEIASLKAGADLKKAFPDKDDKDDKKPPDGKVAIAISRDKDGNVKAEVPHSGKAR